MSTPRNALGDLNSSTLNSRLNENDRPLAAVKSNNENPFRTKSRVERTPDISAIKRRKSVKSALPVRSVVENQVDTCQIDDTSFTSASPRQALFTEPRLSTFNIFKGFALCHEEVAADEEDNLVGTANDNFRQTKSEPLAKSEKSMVTEDVDDVPNSIIEATESSNHDAMDDSTSDNDLNSVESELNQLNIDEVLQAFRDDAEAAEKAIEMATICGRLHPKEFREYLRAFRSPNGKQSDDQIMKEELEWNYTRTQSALILPGVEGASLPTVYRPDSLVFASPTSSLLNMLEMADTPIEGAPARDNLACSPILMSVECTPIPEVDDVWGIPVPKQEEETMKGEASRHHSLKDRTESTRLAVAAAVASVSNFPFATSTPSYPDSTTGMQTTQSGNAIVPLAPKMVRISLFVPSIAEQLRMSETPTAQIPGKEEEAFLPRKVMMRTPPKFPEDTVLKAVLINETEVAAAEEKREELLEGPGVDDSMLQECNTLDIEEPEGEDDRLAVLSANMSLLNDSIRNTSQYTGGLPEWSATELDRVSRVIKRVSVGAADCPNTHSIMRQLQVEIARLTKEVSDQHSELAAVVADKRALESRLEEVEQETQKAGRTIASLQASSEVRSAAHDQHQIDLDLIAAKECIERLGDRKEAIAQRRTLREARLQQMDAEVAAEIASLNARKEIRRESSRHRLLLLPTDQNDIVTDHNEPSGLFSNKSVSTPALSVPAESSTPQISEFLAVSSPSNSSAHFKHPTQPLVPTTDCPFFAPRPFKPVSDGKSFLWAGTGTFSGSKSGAFHVVEKMEKNHPISITENDGNGTNIGEKENTKMNTDEFENVRADNCDTEINENIEDDICNTENSIHGFDDGMDDIEYNEGDGKNMEMENTEASFMVESEEYCPVGNDDESNKENISRMDRDEEDTQQNNREKSIKMKSGDKKARIINVNYYGNLKFVALKVKSSKPRPLNEEEYGVSSESHILNMDNDEAENEGEGENEKDEEKKNMSKAKKRNAIKREKRSRSDSMLEVRDEQACEGAKDDLSVSPTFSSTSPPSEVSSTELKEKSKVKKPKTTSRKSEKDENKIQNLDPQIENEIIENKKTRKSNNEKKSIENILNNSDDVVLPETKTEMISTVIEEKKNKKGEKNKKNDKPTTDENSIKLFEAATSSSGIAEKKNTRKKGSAIEKDLNVTVTKLEGKSDVNCPKIIPLESTEKESVIKNNSTGDKKKSSLNEKEELSIIPNSLPLGPVVPQSVRNATPYALFCASRKAEMKKSKSSLSASEVLKTSSAEWKALSVEDKEEWVQRSVAAGGGGGGGTASGPGGGLEAVGSILGPVVIMKEDVEQTDCISNSVQLTAITAGREKHAINEESKVRSTGPSDEKNKIESEKPKKVSKSKNKKDTSPDVPSKLTVTSKNKEDEEESESSDSQGSSDLYELSKSSKSKKNKKDTSSKKKSILLQTLQQESKTSTGKSAHQNSPPSAFEKEPEEGLFSANLSLSPVLAGPTSPAVNSVTDLEFDMPLPKAKNEKVSRKRKDQQPVVSVPEHSVPESGPSSTDIIDTNVAQKEERHITWSDMPPPAAKSKKPRIQSSSSSSSKHAIPEGKTIENPFPLEPERAARPPRNDQVGDRGKGKLTGPPSSSSSSNLLNTSVSTVSSIFSTASSVRSKSQFVLPKLKKRV